MGWWMAAAALAPYAIAAMQKKPKRPGAPEQVPLKNRDVEIEAMLNEARNPNTQGYNLAAEGVGEQVNRLLGRTGMGGSSVGAQLQGNAQAGLAMKWLEERANRERQALDIALGYDRNQAGWQQQGVNATYNHAMDLYKDTLNRQAQQVQGVSNMINTGYGIYNQDRTQDRLDMIAKRDPYPQAVGVTMPSYYGSPYEQMYPTGGGVMPAEYGYGQAPMPGYRVGGGGY